MHSESNSRPSSPNRGRVKVPKTTGIYKRTTAAGETRYEYAFVDGEGRQRWGTTGKLEDAKREREVQRRKVENGEPIPSKTVTFAELAEAWYEAKAPRLRPRTSRYYRDALNLVLLPRFGRRRVAAIDADAVASLVRDLEREGLHAIDPARERRPLGASSVTNYLKPLQATLRLAVRRRLIGSSPFDVLMDEERPQRGEREQPHEWTDEELGALLAASAELAAERVAKYDYTPLLRVVATLGIRKGEALGLRWEDFDKDGGYLHVRRQWTDAKTDGPTKTPAGVRRLALPDAVRDELIALRLRSRYSADEQPIFASLTGRPLDHRNVTRRGFEPARDRAGLPASLRLHDLRHAAASRLIGSGLDPVTVASVLGHEDANTTLRVYAHLFDRERTDEAVRVALGQGGDARRG